MPLQDITPINDQLADIIVRADEPWIETEPGMAWMKVIWTGPETGRWVALFRWSKGYVAAPHKHLSDAHTYILKGKLAVRDGVLNTGDYDYEPNGVLHGKTEALRRHRVPFRLRRSSAVLRRRRADQLPRLGRAAPDAGSRKSRSGHNACRQRRVCGLNTKSVRWFSPRPRR